MNKKKKTFCRRGRRLDGLLPIFQFESRYNRLYRDTGCRGVQQGTTIRLATLRQGPTTQPTGAATRPAYARGERQPARAWPGRWGVSRYKWLYRDMRGRHGVATQRSRGCDTTQQELRYCVAVRHDTTQGAATRHAMRTAGACGAIQALYHDRGACDTTCGMSSIS